MDWIDREWAKVPATCPHGRPVVISGLIDAGVGRHVRYVPGTIDCPAECYEQYGADRVSADQQALTSA